MLRRWLRGCGEMDRVSFRGFASRGLVPGSLCLIDLLSSISSSSPESGSYRFLRERARSTDLALSRREGRGIGDADGDLEISESDAAGLERDERVVATGDVGTELSPLEFPRW